MIIAEMRPADVPMEILGLQVKRKCVSQNLVELGRQLAHRGIGQIGARIEGSDFVVHGITLRAVAGGKRLRPPNASPGRACHSTPARRPWFRWNQAGDPARGAAMPLSAYIQAAVFWILAAVALFVSAGTVAIAGFWIYLAIFAAVFVASFLALDPGLLRERMRPGGQKPPVALRLFSLVLFLHRIAAGLHRGRYHWSDTVP